jgi:flavodoxin I
MIILILFATYSGGTQTAAGIVAKTLQKKGHSVSIKNPKQVKGEDILSSDLTIMCSPSWDVNGKEGQPHEDFIALMDVPETMVFEKKQFGVLGLGDSSYPNFCGAVNVLESFIAQKKGVLKYPSLRIDGFFYDEKKHTETIQTWANNLG